MEFHANRITGVKLPAREDLIIAFRDFFESKTSTRRHVNTSQAWAVLQVVEYLVADKTKGPNLTLKDLDLALTATALNSRASTRKSPAGKSNSHIQLAEALHNEIRAISYPGGQQNGKSNWDELTSDSFNKFLRVLTRFGSTEVAERLLRQLDAFNPDFRFRDSQLKTKKVIVLHMHVLRGYAKEKSAADVQRYASEMLELGVIYESSFQDVMTAFYADNDDKSGEQLRFWFEKSIAGEKVISCHTYKSLLKFVFRTGNQPEWINTALQQLCDSNPLKRHWDVILQWAVYQGKDIEDIERMIDVMVQFNMRRPEVRPDMGTMIGLIGAAVDLKNPMLAERLNSLLPRLNVSVQSSRPHVAQDYYSLLLESRIIGQDVVGAASAFENLSHCGRIAPASKTSDVINLYIRYLCTETSTDSLRIVEVLSQMERQDGDLEAETVVALCLKFLRDDQVMDMVDTLGLHLRLFSMEEREIVRNQLVAYCLDADVSTARAWDCYSLVRQFFPESSRAQRVELMEGFFNRKRADMASLIFGHMRAHPNDEIRPDLDSYVTCLEGIGAYPDDESLRMVHNMFKMDTLIQPNTRVYNAFIIAYAGSGQPHRAYRFWEQIANSVEGPSYTSIQLVFRALQKMPNGFEKAQGIWDKMQKLEVDVPLHVHDAYTIMAAGQARLGVVQYFLLHRTVEDKSEPSTEL